MVGHQKEGWGTEFGTGGKIIYVGNWRKGKRHGHGTHTEYQENNKPCQRYVGKCEKSTYLPPENTTNIYSELRVEWVVLFFLRFYYFCSEVTFSYTFRCLIIMGP